MPSFLASNRSHLRDRHYIRRATASNHWFDFAASKVQKFERRYGDDFCLIINGSDEMDDAYVIPFRTAKHILKLEYLDDRGRWVGTIVDDHLKLGKAEGSHPVGVHRNAFNLLSR